ncbi:peroxiredoxin [Vibrio harveyi]|nr:peroxiredoxin [Vibrio harveyi]
MVKKALILLVMLGVHHSALAEFPMSNRTAKLGLDNVVSYDGATQFTLEGHGLNVGDAMPSMLLTTSTLDAFDTTKNQGKVRIYSVLTSVDTPVCIQQAQELSEFIDDHPELTKNIEFIAISSDTPFAQQRFVELHDLDDELIFVSDSRKHEFGYRTGSLIQELGLLSRSIIVVDQDNVVVYIQRVPELTTIPNLVRAVKVAKKV